MSRREAASFSAASLSTGHYKKSGVWGERNPSAGCLHSLNTVCHGALCFMGGCKFPTHRCDPMCQTVSDLLCLRVDVVAGEVPVPLSPAAALSDPTRKAATHQEFTSLPKEFINTSIKNSFKLCWNSKSNSGPLANFGLYCRRTLPTWHGKITTAAACWYYTVHVLLNYCYISQNALLRVWRVNHYKTFS